ncbi:hypothetical protein [Proteus phage VTCCBPA139]|nr:hypothetical protein [Proteus phage VTCCBPA139]
MSNKVTLELEESTIDLVMVAIAEMSTSDTEFTSAERLHALMDLNEAMDNAKFAMANKVDASE